MKLIKSNHKIWTFIFVIFLLPSIGSQESKAYNPGDHVRFAEAANEILDRTLPLAGSEIGTYWSDVEDGLRHVDRFGSQDPHSTWEGWHFFNPETHGWGDNAAKAAELNYNWAVGNYTNNNKADAYYSLGRALHFVQDMTVPHHTNGLSKDNIFNNHLFYEEYIQFDLNLVVLVDSTGATSTPIYVSDAGAAYGHDNEGGHDFTEGILGFIDYAAHKSDEVVGWVDGTAFDGEDDFEAAANLLVPMAIRLSAGLMYHFYTQMQGIPINLDDSNASYREVDLSWDLSRSVSTSVVDHFIIEYQTNNGEWEEIQVPRSTTSYTLQNLIPGSYHRVKIYAVIDGYDVNPNDDSIYFITTFMPQPNPIKNFEINQNYINTNSIGVIWDEPNEDWTEKFELTKNNFNSFETVQRGSTSYTFSGLYPETTYTFKIRAVNYEGSSQIETTVGTTEPMPPLPPPEPVTNLQLSKTHYTITANWEPSLLSSSFRIQLKQGSTVVSTKTTTSTQIMFSGLQAGVTYGVYVYPINPEGLEGEHKYKSTTTYSPLNSPTNMRVSGFVIGNNVVMSVTWDTHGSSLVKGYRIYKNGVYVKYISGRTATSWTVTGQINVNYYFKMKAVSTYENVLSGYEYASPYPFRKSGSTGPGPTPIPMSIGINGLNLIGVQTEYIILSSDTNQLSSQSAHMVRFT